DLRRLALREQTAIAHEAAPAADVERNDDPITGLDMTDAWTDVLDHAYGLVAENVTLLHERAQHVVQMEVGSADRRRRDAHDGIGLVLDERVGDVVDAHV